MLNEKMSDIKFPWDGSDIVAQNYCCDNYKVEDTGACSKKAIIFFSSNAIYFPNTEGSFENDIIKKDRYEWTNIAKLHCIRKFFNKIVYVRDIYKQWYITGINKRLNSIDELYIFLGQLLAGYEITTCGTSAGGYMATLMGIKLGAERIISNSGQVNLDIVEGDVPLLEKYSSIKDRKKYFDLGPFIKNNEENIYFFFSSLCQDDCRQMEIIKSDKIKAFYIKSQVHGKNLPSICFPYLLTCSKDKLEHIYFKYGNKQIDGTGVFREMVPIYHRIIYSCLKVIHMIIA